MRSDIQKMDSEIRDLENELNTKRERNEKAFKEIENMEGSKQEYERDLREAQSKRARLQSEVERLESKLTKVSTQRGTAPPTVL